MQFAIPTENGTSSGIQYRVGADAAAVKAVISSRYLMKEQVQVDNNDEQKQGEIIGELMEDVKQKISNTDILTGGDRGYK